MRIYTIVLNKTKSSAMRLMNSVTMTMNLTFFLFLDIDTFKCHAS